MCSEDNVLVIAAHPDDEVLGAGGLIHKLTAGGAKVSTAIVCPGGVKPRPGVTDEYVQELIHQSFRVAKILGVKYQKIGPFDYAELSHESVSRRDVHYWIEAVVEELDPDTIITHSSLELHADHRIVAEAVKVATRPNHRKRKVIHFDPVSIYQDGFIPNYYVILGEQDIEAKESAMSCYDGEIQKDTYGWRNLRAIRAKAIARGLECSAELAEAYFISRDYS